MDTHASVGLPWPRICQLRADYGSGGSEVASGWSASPCTVVTAAHSLVDAKGNLAIAVHGWLGRHKNHPAHAFVVQRSQIVLASAWTANRDRSWDLAVLRLSSRIPHPHAYLACNQLQSRGIGVHGRFATIAGYPETGADILESLTKIQLKVAGHRLAYRAQTGRGMSGAPVFVRHEGHPWVVGVHTHAQTAATQAVFLDDERASWIDAQQSCA
jgi:V8-like Glu-specific endopeptidase